MADVRAVFFDVGETLVNEEGYWGRVARLVGVPRHVVIAALGATVVRGERHRALFAHLGVERPDAVDEVVYGRGELYPDAIPCLAHLKARRLPDRDRRQPDRGARALGPRRAAARRRDRLVGGLGRREAVA